MCISACAGSRGWKPPQGIGATGAIGAIGAMGAIVTGDICSGITEGVASDVTMGVGDAPTAATGAAGRGLHALGTKPSSGPALMGTAPGLD
mmetsp:Transcript_23816/g.51797  ORF Transcript_23816/g.51797 Transcript_23816/m.51797 type:complete len:91 (-) Transcript_23816:3-275(-)